MVTLIVYVLVLSLCDVHVCIQCSALKGSAVAAVKTQECMYLQAHPPHAHSWVSLWSGTSPTLIQSSDGHAVNVMSTSTVIHNAGGISKMESSISKASSFQVGLVSNGVTKDSS